MFLLKKLNIQELKFTKAIKLITKAHLTYINVQSINNNFIVLSREPLANVIPS